jgi:hypothetical protein
MGHAVAQFVKTLRSKAKGRGFDSRFIFDFTGAYQRGQPQKHKGAQDSLQKNISYATRHTVPSVV